MKPIHLEDHPEGGRYLEVFKSNVTVTKADGQIRSALTHIYFSLDEGEVSRFHKVESDEVWNLYQGKGLYLYSWEGKENPPQRIELSEKSETFCHVIPAGYWQAAEPIEGTVLVGCSVGPGFEFTDFELIKPGSDLARRIQDDYPALSKFTKP